VVQVLVIAKKSFETVGIVFITICFVIIFQERNEFSFTDINTDAEFERDLLKERVRSGLAAAKAREKILGRKIDERPKSDKPAPKVIELFNAGNSYRTIASVCQLSKNTVMGIVSRNRSLS
jgi:DNA invertase Pin-like site-specific DNA recombinase